MKKGWKREGGRVGGGPSHCHQKTQGGQKSVTYFLNGPFKLSIHIWFLHAFTALHCNF